MSRVIRIDDEVKAALDDERRPDERSYSPAINRRVRALLIAGAAGAYGPTPPEPPCSLCGTASPAAEIAECDRPDCPLEGAGRD